MSDILPMMTVALVWGVTNPLMKRGAALTLQKKESYPGNCMLRILLEVLQLFCGASYLMPFAVNQCGSLLFYYWLIAPSEESKLSVVIPTVNALTFVFTAIFAYFFNSENLFNVRKILGLAMIVTGVYLTTK